MEDEIDEGKKHMEQDTKKDIQAEEDITIQVSIIHFIQCSMLSLRKIEIL